MTILCSCSFADSSLFVIVVIEFSRIAGHLLTDFIDAAYSENDFLNAVMHAVCGALFRNLLSKSVTRTVCNRHNGNALPVLRLMSTTRTILGLANIF